MSYMRITKYIPFVLLLLFVLLPDVVLAQPVLTGDTGGIVPCSGRDCGTCETLTLANRIVSFIVTIMIAIAVVLLALGGFRLVTSGGNRGEYERAKGSLQSVFIGIIIILASWLIVDTMLRALLFGGGLIRNFGPWNEMQCSSQVAVRDTAGYVPGSSVWINLPEVYSSADAVNNYGSSSDAALAAANTYAAGDCSPASLQSYGMSADQARVFSCIAGPESGCNLNADNPDSTARGVFQVLRGYNNECHNLNLPSCTAAAQAAGWNGSGNLNCSRAFRGGHAIPGNELATYCDAAASNMQCNVDAALCLYEGRDNSGPGGYAPWLGVTGRDHHQAQRACAQRYGG